MTCPKCGAIMQVVALDPATAPWLCARCARGFWAAELTGPARDLYRARHDDWGFNSRVPIQAAVELEISDARSRGTSLREDQFIHADASVLASLVHRPLDAAFAKSLAAFLANSGGA